MTTADLDLLREESRSGSGWASTDSLRTLLRHVDALQAQLDESRGVIGSFQTALRRERADRMVHARNVGRLAEMHFAARHLLAWQQARLIITDAGATRLWMALDAIADHGCDGWSDDGGETCSCHPCVADDALQSAPFHDEIGDQQLATLRAENARLTSERDGLQQDCEDQHALTDRTTSERDAALAQVERLKQALNAACWPDCPHLGGVPEPQETMLESAGPGVMSDGAPAFTMRVVPPQEVMLRIADAMATMLDKAANYVEIEVQHRSRGTFILRLQRASGKSPHQLRQQAESERDAARAEVERLKEQISDEQDLAAQCQALCGECRGLCGGEAALSESEACDA